VVSAAQPGAVFVVLSKRDDGGVAGLGGNTGNEWQRLFTERANAVETAALNDDRLVVVGAREVEGWTVTTLERV
jgi:hypothetical protein